ncbi:hypothetical protein DL96DRAFT_1704929 [Flagelloscypha sp. PMI_526]|nr:hypothetical protein DL96DRAFT_1704929 [Flagelloscypha sp. PMI_526]
MDLCINQPFPPIHLDIQRRNLRLVFGLVLSPSPPQNLTLPPRQPQASHLDTPKSRGYPHSIPISMIHLANHGHGHLTRLFSPPTPFLRLSPAQHSNFLKNSQPNTLKIPVSIAPHSQTCMLPNISQLLKGPCSPDEKQRQDSKRPRLDDTIHNPSTPLPKPVKRLRSPNDANEPRSKKRHIDSSDLPLYPVPPPPPRKTRGPPLYRHPHALSTQPQSLRPPLPLSPTPRQLAEKLVAGRGISFQDMPPVDVQIRHHETPQSLSGLSNDDNNASLLLLSGLGCSMQSSSPSSLGSQVVSPQDKNMSSTPRIVPVTDSSIQMCQYIVDDAPVSSSVGCQINTSSMSTPAGRIRESPILPRPPRKDTHPAQPVPPLPSHETATFALPISSRSWPRGTPQTSRDVPVVNDGPFPLGTRPRVVTKNLVGTPRDDLQAQFSGVRVSHYPTSVDNAQVSSFLDHGSSSIVLPTRDSPDFMSTLQIIAQGVLCASHLRGNIVYSNLPPPATINPVELLKRVEKRSLQRTPPPPPISTIIAAYHQGRSFNS